MTAYCVKNFTAQENKLSAGLALIADLRSHTLDKNEMWQKLCEMTQSKLVNGIGR